MIAKSHARQKRRGSKSIPPQRPKNQKPNPESDASTGSREGGASHKGRIPKTENLEKGSRLQGRKGHRRRPNPESRKYTLRLLYVFNYKTRASRQSLGYGWATNFQTPDVRSHQEPKKKQEQEEAAGSTCRGAIMSNSASLTCLVTLSKGVRFAVHSAAVVLDLAVRCSPTECY